MPDNHLHKPPEAPEHPEPSKCDPETPVTPKPADSNDPPVAGPFDDEDKG